MSGVQVIKDEAEGIQCILINDPSSGMWVILASTNHSVASIYLIKGPQDVFCEIEVRLSRVDISLYPDEEPQLAALVYIGNKALERLVEETEGKIYMEIHPRDG